MQAYEADTAWNRGITCIFFKILIQLYLLRSFLYSLTYFIKEVIKGKIFWRLNLKCWSMRQLWSETEESLAMFQNIDPIVFVLFISLFLTYCIKEGIKGKIFWTLNLKVLASTCFTNWYMLLITLETFPQSYWKLDAVISIYWCPYASWRWIKLN